VAYSKYRAKPTVVDGVRFHSQREARRYQELRLLERAGKIKGLVLQKPYPVMVNGQKVCNYVSDFFYYDQHGGQHTEDVKGFLTPVYRLKKKLVEIIYGIRIEEI